METTDVLSDEHIDPVFRATIDAVEEAIANAICMANDMVGVNSRAVRASPLDRVADQPFCRGCCEAFS